MTPPLNNSHFESLYQAVTHVLDNNGYMSREGVWVIGKKRTISPVNVKLDVETGDVSHLIVKGVYVSLYRYNFNIYTSDYEKTNQTNFIPHNISVNGYTDENEVVSLIVDTSSSDSGGDGTMQNNGGGGGNKTIKSIV